MYKICMDLIWNVILLRPSLNVFFFVQSKLVKDTLRRKERNFQKKKKVHDTILLFQRRSWENLGHIFLTRSPY